MLARRSAPFRCDLPQSGQIPLEWPLARQPKLLHHSHRLWCSLRYRPASPAAPSSKPSFGPTGTTLAHYGVVGDPARVRDPNRKRTVENAIGHTQATALKGRRFESIAEQNEYLEHWETKWAAPRIHGSARRQVEAMFQEERPHLLPLPLLGMQYFTEEQRTVYDDSCVRIDHSSYAARPAAIGSLVLVRLFEHRLEIRDLKTLALLRTHERRIAHAPSRRFRARLAARRIARWAG